MALITNDVAPFTLLPAVTPLSGDEQLSAAEALLSLTQNAEPAVRTYGRTWVFDHRTGQFARNGSSPAGCDGLDALVQWIHAAVRTPRLAALIHSENYGVDIDDLFIGGLGTAAEFADYKAALTDAIILHDRVSQVTDFLVTFASDDDAAFVSFTVLTDQDHQIEITDAPIYGRV